MAESVAVFLQFRKLKEHGNDGDAPERQSARPDTGEALHSQRGQPVRRLLRPTTAETIHPHADAAEKERGGRQEITIIRLWRERKDAEIDDGKKRHRPVERSEA